MKFKRLTVCFGVVAVLLVAFSPSSFGEGAPTRTDPAEYQERDIKPGLKNDRTKEAEKQEPIPEEVSKLQFDQPLEQEYKEMVHALSFNGEDKVTTEMVASRIGLFDTTNPLPQQTPDNDSSSVAWLPWVFGSIIAGLLITLCAYILPKGFSQLEQ